MLRAARALLFAAAILFFATHARAQTPLQSLTSPGPLTTIFLGNEGSSQVAHITDGTVYGFYPPSTTPGDYGTFVVVNDMLYAPDFLNHDFGSTATANIGANTPFVPVSQSLVTGTGTNIDPYRVVTVYDVGATGLRVTQTDGYVVGEESFRTDLLISSTATIAVSAILYRAADCYLGGSDSGYGYVDTISGAVACSLNPNNMPAGRIEQFLPASTGSTYYQAGYGEVWTWIGTHLPFPSTCRCSDLIDNGAGISWSITVPAAGTLTRSHYTTFSTVGVLPLTTAKQADTATVSPGSGDGYAITLDNPNALQQSIATISDTLPAGFTYLAGSTTGAFITDPAITGQTLTWTGPVTIAGQSTIMLHFNVTVATATGTYFNNATGTGNGGITISPTGNTAPIYVRTGAPAIDAGVPVDGGNVGLDAGQLADGQVVPIDAGGPADAAPDNDAATIEDSGIDTDAGGDNDSGNTGSDSGSADDSGVGPTDDSGTSGDSGSTTDAGGGTVDTGVAVPPDPPDAGGDLAEAGPRTTTDPRDRGGDDDCTCRSTRSTADASWMVLGFLLAIATRLRWLSSRIYRGK